MGSRDGHFGGDYLEDFFKLVREKQFFPLHIRICKVAGLLPLGV
jgi:hypothetical protein